MSTFSRTTARDCQMILISLDLSSTATWPKVRWCSLAHALTMCSGFNFMVARPE